MNNNCRFSSHRSHHPIDVPVYRHTAMSLLMTLPRAEGRTIRRTKISSRTENIDKEEDVIVTMTIIIMMMITTSLPTPSSKILPVRLNGSILVPLGDETYKYSQKYTKSIFHFCYLFEKVTEVTFSPFSSTSA